MRCGGRDTGLIIAAMICLAALAPVSTWAQTWPVKPVRIIVPYPAGGPIDGLARLVSPRLTPIWGQQIIIENRAGANSIIGSDATAKAAPDGYTMLINSASFSINASLYPKLPYDTVKDFAAIGPIAAGPSVLVVHPSVPAKTMQEFIALVRSRTEKYSYASSGSGTPGHLAVELLKTKLGTDLVHVPYKGAAPAITDLLGGQVQVASSNISAVIGHIKSGRLRALAVTSRQRWPSVPDLPTVAEAAVPGYEASNWYAVFGPAGILGAIVSKVNADVTRASQSREMRDSLDALGVDGLRMTPEEFTAYFRAEVTRWAEAVRISGAKPD